MPKFPFVLLITLLSSVGNASSLPELRFSGPATLVSYPIFRMIETGALSAHAETVRFQAWRTPDQLRAMVLNNEADITATPTNVAAIFYNRGAPVRLMNVSTWNLLWLISRNPEVKQLADLEGKPLLIPYRNDMPDIVFQLLAPNAVKAGNQIRYTANPLDIVQLLMAGKADHAILPEPAVSMLLMRNNSKATAEHRLHRALPLATPWQQRFPASPEMPQAGLMANGKLATDAHLMKAINQAYAEATEWCVNEPADCAALAHRHLPHIPQQAAEDAIRNTRLHSVTAAEARPALEQFFNQIAAKNPARIGGKLPTDGFYQP